MVDSFNIRKDLNDITEVHLTRAINAKEGAVKTISELLLEQLEFSNTIVLNKSDMVKEEELNDIKKFVHKLNPEAEVLTSNYSQIPVEKILETKKFDLD